MNRLESLRFLVVDDYPNDLKCTKVTDYLQNHGYDFDFRSNGEDVIKALEVKPPRYDAVILDAHFPINRMGNSEENGGILVIRRIEKKTD